MSTKKELGIESIVLGVIKEHCDLQEVQLDTDLREELDSLELVELFLIIEEKFGIEIHESDIEDIQDVQGIIDFIENTENQ